MKHFVTFVACLASFFALAQNPNYDPDSNGDDLIGAEDLQSFLALYNTLLTSNETVVGYVTDLDSAGTYDTPYSSQDITYYSVPDSVDFLRFPPGETGEVYVVLNSDARKSLTVTCTPAYVYLESDSLVRVSDYINDWGMSSNTSLVTWLFIDGRWWPH